MDILHQQIARARRRLALQKFVGALAWCWFVALSIAAVAIGVSKIWVLNVEPAVWLACWLGGSLAVGLVAALVWTFLRRQSALEAAIEIDRRFGLKERVSSSLALAPAELETDIGRALVSDAAKRVDRIDLAERFGFRAERKTLLPILPALAALGLALFVPNPVEDNPAAATTTETSQATVKKSTESLQKKIEERRKEAQEKGLQDADLLFKKLEDGTKELNKKRQVDQKQALIKLNDLAKDLEKRREQLVADDRMKQHLNQLKDLDKGPADKLAQALKNGNLKQAKQELEKLKEKLANDKLDEQEKQQLGQQMKQMQQALEKATQAQQQAKQDLQQQIDQQRAQGNTGEADKLQQQLDKMNQQNDQMNKLGQMAQKLSKAADSLQQGQTKEAADALDELSDQVGQMQKESDELSMLDDAMEQIADAKNSMGCKSCQGEGCAECQGQGRGQGKKGGDGLGAAMGGKGARPESKTKTGFYDSSVKQNVGRGAAVVTDFVDGPSRKGEVQEQIKNSFESSRREATDPLTGQRLPRDYREHAKKYFDALREGQK